MQLSKNKEVLANDLHEVRGYLCEALCMLSVSKDYCVYKDYSCLQSVMEAIYKYIGDAEEKISLMYNFE